MQEDDIVYGKKPLGPRVIHVVPNDDFTLTLTFTNGEVRCYDMNPLLDKEIFGELQNIGYFRCVRVNGGTVE